MFHPQFENHCTSQYIKTFPLDRLYFGVNFKPPLCVISSSFMTFLRKCCWKLWIRLLSRETDWSWRCVGLFGDHHDLYWPFCWKQLCWNCPRRRGGTEVGGWHEQWYKCEEKNGWIKSKSKIARSHAPLKNAGLGLCGRFTMMGNRADGWMCF